MRNVIAISLLLAATTGVSATATPKVSDDSGMRPASVGGDRDEHGCIGSAGYSWDAENALCVRPWEKEAQFGKPMAPNAKHFNWHGKRFELHVRYPKTGVAVIDKTVVSAIRSALVDFKYAVSDVPNEDVWDGKYQMYYDFEKTSYRGFASVTLSDYRFTGGAHGYTNYGNFNFDLKTGKYLEDSDVFKDKAAAQKKIAGLVYERLLKEASDRIYDDRDQVKTSLLGVGGLKVLRFTKNGLEFQSYPYQVGPYAAGVVKITVPYSEILDLFQDDVAERLK